MLEKDLELHECANWLRRATRIVLVFVRALLLGKPRVDCIKLTFGMNLSLMAVLCRHFPRVSFKKFTPALSRFDLIVLPGMPSRLVKSIT